MFPVSKHEFKWGKKKLLGERSRSFSGQSCCRALTQNIDHVWPPQTQVDVFGSSRTVFLLSFHHLQSLVFSSDLI